MSQMPDKIWLHKDTKYNTEDIVCGYQYEFAQEIEDEGIENFIEYVPAETQLRDGMQNRLAKGVLSSCALSFINYLDAHRYEGKMCVSNGECEDIENAFHNAMWDRLHRYYCKYIEKHGEQKPQRKSANKAEPKFKVGDWVVFNNHHNSVYQVEKIENCEYTLRHFLGGSMPLSFSHEDMIRPWTIKDAKDGDVLKEDSCIFILKKMKSEDTAITHCCLFDDGDFNLSSTLRFNVDNTYPVTKEQRDTLMKAMADAGYTFDFDKKKLNEIEKKYV